MDDPSRVLSWSSLQRLLVRAAEVVQATANARELSARSCPDSELYRPRGVFVTLRRSGELAGCIGFTEPPTSVWQLVERAARAAAAEDTRFRPIETRDLAELVVEVSVLTTPVPTTAESFEPGLHGLVLRAHGVRALLLPQVAVEHELDRVGFLEALCHKAGVPTRTWKEPSTELLAFEAQVVAAPYPALIA